MKLATLFAAGGLALGLVAAPALAQPPHTTVHRVHGPLKVLPHHNRKICTTRYVHHKRVRRCNYR